MKAKYRLGELIQFVENGEQHGIVTGVIKRQNGFSYEVGDREVAESDVVAAFRPKAARTVTKKTKPQKTSRAAKTTAQDAVTQQ